MCISWVLNVKPFLIYFFMNFLFDDVDVKGKALFPFDFVFVENTINAVLFAEDVPSYFL